VNDIGNFVTVKNQEILLEKQMVGSDALSERGVAPVVRLFNIGPSV
jgi:hypothetical protein